MAAPHGWRRELKDLGRAVAAGSIVGMPLLFTMEMWWRGLMLSETHLLVLLAGVLFVNFLFCWGSGFRPEHGPIAGLLEAVASVGIGIVLSALILWLVGEVGVHLSMGENAGKILLEAAVVSIGVSFANSDVRGESRTGDDEGQEGEDDDPERAQLQADLRDVVATVVGALVFALNIAPTEEVQMIAYRLSPLRLLAVLAASIGLCYVILFVSEFGSHVVKVESLFQHPAAETLMATSVSLLVAFALLVLVGPPGLLASASATMACTITLGLPAVVGGAAGRLII